MTDQRDREDAGRRTANLGDRTVSGGAPIGGRSMTASSGAFDTVGGGDLGGPGSRDPGDSAGDLRPDSTAVTGGDTDGDLADAANVGDRVEAERLAARVFGDAPANEADGALRAQAEAQESTDVNATQDTSRAQSGGLNNDSL